MNELERLLKLSEFNLDFTDIHNNFKDLNRLAAKIAGTNVSLVNLVDCYTQWTVSSYGLELKQMPRNESVCQHTISHHSTFEVPDLSADSRFKNYFYVTGDLSLRYYFGVPLTTEEGVAIGALCVLHPETKTLSEEQIESLKIIADEVVSKLRAIKTIEKMKSALKRSSQVQRKIIHDVRGPISGIIGLTNVILEHDMEVDVHETLEYIQVIQKSANSVINLSDEILRSEANEITDSEVFNLLILKHKLELMYLQAATTKEIDLQITLSTETELMPISRTNLLQIAGNLVSNAIKFTLPGGSVRVDLNLEMGEMASLLHIIVTDTGIGLSGKQIELIKHGNKNFSLPVEEDEYVFGLVLVRSLVDSARGELKVSSSPGKGSRFEVLLMLVD